MGKIAHSAFIDLENALGQRVGNGWKRIFRPIQQELHAAIGAKDWAKANKLVDTINTDDLVAINFNFAKTIAVSSLLLGASRLVSPADSHVAANPPNHQIGNALTQWGFVVARNAAQNVRLSLHLMLARLEHKAHEEHQMIQTIKKFDPNHDEKGRFTFSMTPGAVEKITVRSVSDLLDDTHKDTKKIEMLLAPDKSQLARFTGNGNDIEYLRGLRLANGQIVWWDADAIHLQIMDALKRGGVQGVPDPDEQYLNHVIGPIESKQILHDMTDDGIYSQHRQVQKDESDDPEQLADDPKVLELIDSIRVDGANFMSLAANLMVSRLSSFGFLLEAQQQGIEKYEISAILDDRTCPVCEALDGQVFSIQDGIAQAASIMEADDADSLKSVAPWPSQSKSSVESLQNSDAQDLVDSGLALPPYHAGCRCITVDSSDDQSSSTASTVEDAATAIADGLPSVSQDEISAILGLVLVPDEIHDEFAGEDDEEDTTDTLDENPDDVDQELDESDDSEEEPSPNRRRSSPAEGI